MADISLTLDIHASPDLVFDIVSTAGGIRQWWSPSVTDDHAPHGDIVVRFGEQWKLVLRKLDETRNQCVAFQITKHNSDEWVDTELHFALERQDDWTILKFDHRGWADKTDFFRFCSAKWVTFLLSIKQAAETGEGMPYPDEIKIGRYD